ncbi:MAG TPA: fumarylacetoacetate hydrolase family protein [Stellaceae bacterium]|nr:fumarylacetoacetate hydrolase family protein [Stellaceae bacterium]
MNGTPFKLGTFATTGGGTVAGVVLGDDVFGIAATADAFGGRGRLSGDSLDALLPDWERNFAVLQEIVAFIEKEGARSERFARVRAPLEALRPLPPIARPGKMFYAAQNFQEHVDEMLRAGMSPAGRRFTGEKSTTRPYLFLKAPSCLCGARDDIPIPLGMKRIDWEAEIALAIGRPGKRISAARALDHIAGFMTTNDVSCRDLQIREDRPGLRSDWLGGKSHDNFAPMGPFLVPRAFVADHMNLRIHLSVNGEVKQDGNTSQFIFTLEEQIEYASNILSLQSGDIFSGGTCGGVGQGTHTFLQAGDVMETEIEGLGRMRNRFVEEHPGG